MADITMCINSSCPWRRHCYRYQAQPGMRQSYAHYEIELDPMDCDAYWRYTGPVRITEEMEKVAAKNSLDRVEVEEGSEDV